MPPISINFNLPFDEAIQQMASRGVVLPDRYYGQLQGLHKQLAFSIAHVAKLDQLQAVLDSLTAHLKNGGTFASWQKHVDVKALGLPKHRLDNIFRTNIQQAYNHGHWQQAVANKSTHGYLLYDAINDSRTRPTHKANDGIIRKIDDPIWRRIWFSRSVYRCRCRLISLTEKQAIARSGNGQGIYKTATEDPLRDKAWDSVDVMNEDFLTVGLDKVIADRLANSKISPVLSSAFNNAISDVPSMKIIELEGFAAVQKVMSELAVKKPEWFPDGFNGIHAVANSEFFAAYYEKAFYFSTTDELLKGFKPASNLVDAIEKISAKSSLAFNEEYALETLWHEMMHVRTGITTPRLVMGEEPLNEGMVQLAARHTYQALMVELGGTTNHQVEILQKGYSYPIVTTNLLELINQAGISGAEVEAIILSYGNDYLEPLKALLMQGLKTKRVGTLLNMANTASLEQLQQKIMVQQRHSKL